MKLRKHPARRTTTGKKWTRGTRPGSLAPAPDTASRRAVSHLSHSALACCSRMLCRSPVGTPGTFPPRVWGALAALRVSEEGGPPGRGAGRVQVSPKVGTLHRPDSSLTLSMKCQFLQERLLQPCLGNQTRLLASTEQAENMPEGPSHPHRELLLISLFSTSTAPLCWAWCLLFCRLQV